MIIKSSNKSGKEGSDAYTKLDSEIPKYTELPKELTKIL